MKLCLFLFLLITAVSVCPGNQRFYTKQEILSQKPAEMFTLTLQQKEVLVTIDQKGTRRMPQGEVSFWIGTGNGYELLRSIKSGIGETFEKPGTFHVNGSEFLTISTAPQGSSGFVQEDIYWIAPDVSMIPVDFQQASEMYEHVSAPGEIPLTGGEKEFFVQDDQLKFEFWVAREGDPHCCPTGGIVTGTYKVVGKPQYDFFKRKYVGAIQIQVDQMQHVSDTAAASLAK